MERLTKKELRALLEFIKECYPICDIETFAQRVVSRLSKIVPPEFISYNVVNPRRRRDACATYPHAAYTTSQKKILEPRVGEQPIVIHHGRPLSAPGLAQQVLSTLGREISDSSTAHKAGRSQL